MADYDRTEASRLLVEFAHRSRLEKTVPPFAATEQFIDLFLQLAESAGFTTEKTRKFARVGARNRNCFLLWDEGGDIAVCEDEKGRQGKRLDLVWDPISERYESTADDPASTETGYRKPRRSALAVLAEDVVTALAK